MQRIIGFLPLRGLAIAAGAAIWLFSVGAYAQQPAPPGDGAMHGRGMGPGMIAPGLMIPNMNAQRGRRLFAEKGCIVCHSVKGIGGEDGASFDVATMPNVMNPFEFAARMWRGARPMLEMQDKELGYQIELSGDELADIIAFVHSPTEQKKFSEKDIPPNIKKLMGHD